MAGPLRRLVQGEALSGLPGDTWNAFCDTVQTVQRQSVVGGRLGGELGFPILRCHVQNTTGAAITADHPVLEIDGPIYNTDDRANIHLSQVIRFRGKTPTASATIGDIVILGAPLPSANTISRRGVLMGPTWADVNVTDAGHTGAIPIDGDNTQLASSSTGGAKILWKPSDTGAKKCLILLGGGGGSDLGPFTWGRTTSIMTGASTWALAGAGSGMWVEINDAGDPVGDPVEVLNRSFNEYGSNVPMYTTSVDGGPRVAVPFCTPGP